MRDNARIHLLHMMELLSITLPNSIGAYCASNFRFDSSAMSQASLTTATERERQAGLERICRDREFGIHAAYRLVLSMKQCPPMQAVPLGTCTG